MARGILLDVKRKILRICIDFSQDLFEAFYFSGVISVINFVLAK
jgi:hypothetical protein